MNQIIFTGTDKKNVDIVNVIKFFSICIIVFGITLITGGSYAMHKKSQETSTENIPNVYMERISDEILIKVENTVTISEFIYSWNNGEKTILLPDSKTLEEKIPLLNENCVLNIQIVDKNGKKTNFTQEWDIEGIDMQKPIIEVQTDERERTIIIHAKDETEIDYITYRWNDNEEIKVNVNSQNKKEIQKKINMEIGDNTLEITAVDKSGNKTTEKKKIIISSAPKIKLKKEKNKLHIAIEDDMGLEKVTVNINGKEYSGDNLDRKSIKLAVPLNEGNNIISITAINKNDIESKDIKEIEYIP